MLILELHIGEKSADLSSNNWFAPKFFKILTSDVIYSNLNFGIVNPWIFYKDMLSFHNKKLIAVK